MATWIITTGSNDVKLKNTRESIDNWRELYPSKIDPLPSEVKNKRNEFYFGDQSVRWLPGDKLKNQKEYIKIPPRILGLAYQNRQEYYNDLAFPILDKLIYYFQFHGFDIPRRIIIFYTDQKNIFTEESKENNSPFWYDTCYLQPLIEWFIKKKTQIEPEFIPLNIEPSLSEQSSNDNQGIDHWDLMLNKVTKLFKDIPDFGDTIYVSHQAGTPAISSAVQFTTISEFSRSQIQFLTLNRYALNQNEDQDKDYESEEYQPELIPISNYWQSIQIQKARKLITDGNVGAAKILLENSNISYPKDLDYYIDLFNLKNTDPNQEESKKEFEPEAAFQRIRKTLDLIEICFRTENYLQGITLISAAQETFMKAAIVALVKVLGLTYKLGTTKESQEDITVDDLIVWNKKGLAIKPQKEIKKLGNIHNNSFNEDLFNILCFPKPQPNDKDFDDFFYKYLSYSKEDNNQKKEFKFTINCIQDRYFKPHNFRILKWLKKLINNSDSFIENQFQKEIDENNWTWDLLEGSCKYYKEYEQDRRNQLMHNLRGVKKEDVLEYIYGNFSGNSSLNQMNQNVENVYKEEVKKHFVKVLSFVRAIYIVSILQTKPVKENESDKNYIDEELKRIADELQIPSQK